ncbi:uncharacterized protein F5Z01DRAFT_676472 [Emericellopsis atlantica]|uniref:Uncharacterized protein n=1 Tax=Emericellopsis atlantica TaxID=2614577 RepID=A0A9P8CNN0_9HYPO|nr:uncharacterized protein F5Z01DRAFT_676472 [Emericellopsis atlantica]KAG9251896.1 hypothetical protein F5Z01DRAFT_676472 [Emericellopsis atlantica]
MDESAPLRQIESTDSTPWKTSADEEEVEPTILTMHDDHISQDGEPLYSISRSLTALKQERSSIRLERVDSTPEGETNISESSNTSKSLIFYLVHPLNSHYRTDKPAYFATCAEESGLGNIELEIEKKGLSKTKYKVQLSPGRSASSDPLFHSDPTTALTAKTNFVSGKYFWSDSQGKKIAQEELTTDNKHQLKIIQTMQTSFRDAVVAAWCLRVWSEVGESRQTKTDRKPS